MIQLEGDLKEQFAQFAADPKAVSRETQIAIRQKYKEAYKLAASS